MTPAMIDRTCDRSDGIALDERSGWWLIGSVMATPALMADSAELSADDLPQSDQRVWWRCLQQMHVSGITTDVAAVADALEADGVLSDMGGPSQVMYLADHAPYLPDTSHWLQMIRRAAARRRLDAETLTIRRMLADPTVSSEEIAARLAESANILTVNQPSQFRTMTSAELDAADLTTEYLVSDVMARMQSTIIAAAKKSLKTSIAIDLTLSLASRCYFLGKFGIPIAVRVGLMSGESGDATIQETARRIAKSKLWPHLSDYENAVWSFDLPRLGHPQTKRELSQFIRDQALEVLIIDPAYLCLDLGDDAGNLFSVGPKLRELTDIQHETGCTIVIIHHNVKSKGDPFAVPELESIAWSGFQEWARQWILIGRREAYNPEQAGSHKLWLSVGGSAGHSGLWGIDIEEGTRTDPGGRRWEVSIDGASKIVAANISERESTKEQQAQAKATRQLEADAAKLLDQYLLRPDGDTEKVFREKARLSGTRGGLANDKLLADGLIVACEITKNGRKYDGYRAAGLTGTDRDSSGTANPVPVGAQSGTTAPIGGSPGPAHRDIDNSLFEGQRDSGPDERARTSVAAGVSVPEGFNSHF